MKSRLRQLIIGSAISTLLISVVIAADCAYSKRSANTSPCAIVGVCVSNVPYFQDIWKCNDAKTFPFQIHKECTSSASEAKNCNGTLVQCYRSTTCEAYLVKPQPPEWGCKELAPFGDWTNAEEKETVDCQ